MKKLADFKKEISESTMDNESHLSADLSEAKIKEPPATLLMRRKAIRMFPDGKRVVLYYVDKLNRYISIPYDEAMGMHDKGIPMSEQVINEGVLQTLKSIVKTGQSKDVMFSDGGQMKVDLSTAKAILNVHAGLTDANNVKKIETMINKDKNNFTKISMFAHGAHVS